MVLGLLFSFLRALRSSEPQFVELPEPPVSSPLFVYFIFLVQVVCNLIYCISCVCTQSR